MRFWKLFLPLLASTLCFAVQPDRITGPIDSSQMVVLKGNVHGFAQSRYDLGRADGSKLLYGVTLAFHPSASQQNALNLLLAQQQDRSSPNFHKWLTPAQFADRFGMTQNDIDRVRAWLELQGFTVTSVANSRNQISFDGTVSQIESVFATEIHDYLVDSQIHFANATNPSIPAALAGSVLSIGHLHNFSPKPHSVMRKVPSIGADPHFTSHVSGDHFLTPGDFSTIYDIQSGMDGTGQTIAIMGQSFVSSTDLSNFRSAAGLAAKAPQLILYPATSTATRCTGDEGESDLDLEWSGGVAPKANIIFVYAGLVSGDSCSNRTYTVWDSLQQTIDNNYAPVISTSYGFCESGLPPNFPQEVQGWVQQGNLQNQTVIASSGDSGAADCDPNGTDPNDTSATGGLAVDVPASIPEVTGMGGTEFTGDAAGTVSGNNAGATQYWSGTTGGTDTISSALSYIPEMGWNDTTENLAQPGGTIAASGGGASASGFFTKPSWQTGTGVPNDGKRDVPDLALNASPDHDGYLFCSEDGPNNTIVQTCTTGFRDSSNNLAVVGGTSAAAPTFAAIVALLNQYLITNSFQSTPGIGNANPNLYYIAANNPTAMNDITTGNNIVPCTAGTPNCPSTSPFQFGFDAGAGYDQVTGLGSVNAHTLAVAWGELFTATTTSVSPSAASIVQTSSVTLTATVTPSATTGVVSFNTNNSTTSLGTGALSGGTATLSTTALPSGTNAIVGKYAGINAASTSPAVTVNVTPAFALSFAPPSLTVPAGQTATTVISITPSTGIVGTVTFTNSTASTPGSCTSGLPAGTLCSFSPTSVVLSGISTSPSTVTLTITTTANMALPAGVQAITVTGTGTGPIAGAINTAPVNLTVAATNETFTLATTGAQTFPVAAGGTAAVSLNVTGTGAPISFVTNNVTSLPLTYTCTGTPSLSAAEISCQLPNNGQPDSAAAVTVNLVTTPVTTHLLRPTLGHGSQIFYALLLPGVFGIMFAAGSRSRGMRMLGLIVVLGFSTLWLGSCGGNNGNTSLQNSGTPAGSYVVTINATTGGPHPVTGSVQVTLSVTQ